MKQKSISVQINGITHKLVEGYIGTICSTCSLRRLCDNIEADNIGANVNFCDIFDAKGNEHFEIVSE